MYRPIAWDRSADGALSPSSGANCATKLSHFCITRSIVAEKCACCWPANGARSHPSQWSARSFPITGSVLILNCSCTAAYIGNVRASHVVYTRILLYQSHSHSQRFCIHFSPRFEQPCRSSWWYQQ
jgi:hypothetical protein